MNKKEDMACALLSIYDYLTFIDNGADMTELNKETLTEMMFRKMEHHGVDLNKALNFTHLKPIKYEK